PFSITSDASVPRRFEICVRTVGAVSGVLHKKEAGDVVWVRGPYGTCFDTADYEGGSVVFIAGGLGLVPLRPVILECLSKRDRFGRVALLYGSRNIRDMVYRQFAQEWEKRPDIDVRIILDDAAGTQYPQGLITALIDEAEFEPGASFVICGPPVMYRFVLRSLHNKGVADERIWLSLERHMKCGVGKCGHCRLDDICVCEKGPVFNYTVIRDKRGAI
ncbi:MAG: FAD/NAD(P)-binding protein, partial [Bacillota bacterium]